jgi:hypothetical protein
VTRAENKAKKALLFEKRSKKTFSVGLRDPAAGLRVNIWGD